MSLCRYFGSLVEEVVCNRDDRILIPLFNFEPVKGLEYTGDIKMWGGWLAGHTVLTSTGLDGADGEPDIHRPNPDRPGWDGWCEC